MRDRWTPGELTGRWKGRQAGEQGDSRADRETGKQVRRGQMEAVREWPGEKGAKEGAEVEARRGVSSDTPPFLADLGRSPTMRLSIFLFLCAVGEFSEPGRGGE